MDDSSPVIWDYPENNYSYYAYDFPEGVLPRYNVIYMPKLAYLLNGLQERSNLNAASDPSIVTLMFLEAISGSIIHGVSLYFVWTNRKLSLTVRAFLLFDCYSRLSQALLIFFDAQCILTWNCMDAHGYPFNWLMVNLVWSNYQHGMEYATHLISNWLSLNRFFAVFFDGSFYRPIEWLGIPQIILSWLFFSALHLWPIGESTDNIFHVITYNGWMYYPLSYDTSWIYVRDMLSLWLTVYIGWFTAASLVVSLALDVPTFIKISLMSEKSSQKSNQAEHKLFLMILITHVTMAAQEGCAKLLNLLEDGDPMNHYLLSAFFPLLFRLFMGSTVIYFMHASRKVVQNAQTVSAFVI